MKIHKWHINRLAKKSAWWLVLQIIGIIIASLILWALGAMVASGPFQRRKVKVIVLLRSWIDVAKAWIAGKYNKKLWQLKAA